jgi:predicted TIM-barrel fold metal-dependent hydrolase
VPCAGIRQKRAVIIDAHVHLYPTGTDLDPSGWAAQAGEHHWAILCTRRRRDGRPVQTLPTREELMAAMDAAGVERAVLLGWYWEKAATCTWQNRFYAACVREHPDRLSAFATVHPEAGMEATLAELHRAREDGLIGIGELSPHSQNYPIDHPVFAAVLARAGEYGWPVNLHVTDPAGMSYRGRVETPLADFVTLARRFPATNFILAHWGGLLPLLPAHVGVGQLANMYFDTAASPLLYEADVWSRALPAIGSDRVLFGSDFPLNLYPRLDERPSLVRLVAEARHGGAGPAVLAANARRLLRL